MHTFGKKNLDIWITLKYIFLTIKGRYRAPEPELCHNFNAKVLLSPNQTNSLFCSICLAVTLLLANLLLIVLFCFNHHLKGEKEKYLLPEEMADTMKGHINWIEDIQTFFSLFFFFLRFNWKVRVFTLLFSSGYQWEICFDMILFLFVLLRSQLKYLCYRNDTAAVSSLLCLLCLIRKIPLMTENANQWCALPAITGPYILCNPLFTDLMKVIVAFESSCDSISQWFQSSALLDFGSGINQECVFACQNGSGTNESFLGGIIILCFLL